MTIGFLEFDKFLKVFFGDFRMDNCDSLRLPDPGMCVRDRSGNRNGMCAGCCSVWPDPPLPQYTRSTLASVGRAGLVYTDL
jgi:hypothetical protein